MGSPTPSPSSPARILLPGERLVIGPNDNSGTNGGVDIDILFSTMPVMSTTSGTISLVKPGAPDLTIDTVSWDSTWKHESGNSLAFTTGVALIDSVTENDDPLLWCPEDNRP